MVDSLGWQGTEPDIGGWTIQLDDDCIFRWHSSTTSPTAAGFTVDGDGSILSSISLGSANTVVFGFCCAIISNDTSICQGDSILLTAAGSTTGYNWVDSLTFTPILATDSFYMASPITTTTYAMYNTTDTSYVTVTVLPIQSTNVSDTICQGDSAQLPDGSYTSIAGVFYDTLVTISGCDSTITLTVTVDSSYSTSISVTICSGDSVLIPSGSYVSVAGTYTDSLTATSGCDSVFTTTLSVDSVVTNSISSSICDFDSLFVGGGWQSTTGAYTDTLLTSAGCDSIVTVNLTVIAFIGDSVTTIICDGDSVLLGGAFQTVAGNYNDTVAAASGCDSVITTTLSLDPLQDATISSVPGMCLNGAAITLSAATPGGIWGGTGITDATTGLFNPAIAGVGTHQIIYITSGTCSDVDTTLISVYELPVLSFASTPESCEGQGNGTIDLTVRGGAVPYTYLWNDQGSSIIEDFDSIAPGTYIVIVNDSNSCTGTGSISVVESTIACYTPYVYVPNIFSPNGDGENDKLYVQGKGIEEMTFVIYDRWGEKVFETNDQGTGWDGTYKGKAMNEAVFVYYVKASLINNETIESQGNISLVR